MLWINHYLGTDILMSYISKKKKKKGSKKIFKKSVWTR